jgi:hypothetical protein
VCERCSNGWELNEETYNKFMFISINTLTQERTMSLWEDISKSVNAYLTSDEEDFSLYLKLIVEKYDSSDYVRDHIERFMNYVTSEEQ